LARMQWLSAVWKKSMYWLFRVLVVDLAGKIFARRATWMKFPRKIGGRVAAWVPLRSCCTPSIRAEAGGGGPYRMWATSRGWATLRRRSSGKLTHSILVGANHSRLHLGGPRQMRRLETSLRRVLALRKIKFTDPGYFVSSGVGRADGSDGGTPTRHAQAFGIRAVSFVPNLGGRCRYRLGVSRDRVLSPGIK